MEEHKKYLTIHGHFYQPPRENPWLEEIEIQDSAAPFHNWNARITSECYEPNSVSRIVDSENKILNIVNNYEYMSFNFGPTLLSWMEKYSKKTYDKIVEADKNSRKKFSGHSCAIAQVYNHIILPLANEKDKETQIKWGIQDYRTRFGHKPEGMWLAETAVDDETLEMLVKCGIKFTILSPYQAQCIRKLDKDEWYDVSWGSIDPSMPYRYYVKGSNKQKYIDIFFYDGTISKSVAFDNLLMDGQKFAYRLNDGYDEGRGRPQLVNIATDGESYGHHTKFGDMALAYVLSVKAKDLGFEITNYGEFLEKFPPLFEVEVKPESSWSCCHGVGRWQEDCGCSTGGQPGWNQRWRSHLRKALDDLRNDLIILCQIEGSKYFTNFWEARNNYIDVILDRTPERIDKFLAKYQSKKLTKKEKVAAIKLLEIQRQCLLMYTSCGWFFSEISGIETVQIMKYALRAMELAADFTDENYEKKFVNTLSKAQSNIREFGDGRNIYEKFVKPSSVGINKITAHCAIYSLFMDTQDEGKTFCYKIKKINYRKKEDKRYIYATGKIEITSMVTLEKYERTFAAASVLNGNICCVVFDENEKQDIKNIRKKLEKVVSEKNNFQESFEKQFDGEFYTVKDVLIDVRKIILTNVLQQRLSPLGEIYQKIYNEMKGGIIHMTELGIDVPEVFRLAAKYSLTHQLENCLKETSDFQDKKIIETFKMIKEEADKFHVNINKSQADAILNKKINRALTNLAKTFEMEDAQETIGIFNIVNILGIDINIRNAQNIYFNKIYKHFDLLIEQMEKAEDKNKERMFMLALLKVGKCLNINTDFFHPYIDKASLPNR